MLTGLSRIVFLLFLFVTMIHPYVWAKDRDVTIVYSNNVNGQVYPAG